MIDLTVIFDRNLLFFVRLARNEQILGGQRGIDFAVLHSRKKTVIVPSFVCKTVSLPQLPVPYIATSRLPLPVIVGGYTHEDVAILAGCDSLV